MYELSKTICPSSVIQIVNCTLKTQQRQSYQSSHVYLIAVWPILFVPLEWKEQETRHSKVHEQLCVKQNKSIQSMHYLSHDVWATGDAFQLPLFLLFSRILLKSVTFIRNNNFLFEPDRPIWRGYQRPGILGQLNRPLVVWRPFIFHDIVSCGFVSGCNVSSLAQLTVCQYLGNSVKGRF